MCGHAGAKVLGRRLNRHQGLRPRQLVGIATTVVRCSACGLIYSNPRPAPVTLAQHYDTAPEDYWRSSYFEETTEYFEGEIATFRELWNGRGAPRALDIGAGLGKAMKALTRHGFDAHGLEPSAAFRERAVASGIEPERLQLASVETGQHPARAFDFITFGAVLEHLEDPAGSLEQALVWTADGGLLHVEVPSAKWLVARMLDVAYRVQGLDYVTNLSPMHPPFHLYEFTLEAFRRHAQRAGYELAHHRFHVAETFMPKPLRPIASRVMAATDTGMQLEVWLRPSAAR